MGNNSTSIIIDAAYLAACAALEAQDAKLFFEHLAILQEAHAEHEKSKKLNFTEFLGKLNLAHKNKIMSLSDKAIAFYQEINSILHSFKIVGSTILTLLLKENPDDCGKLFLAHYKFITGDFNPNLACLRESLSFYTAQLRVQQTIAAQEASADFAPKLLEQDNDIAMDSLNTRRVTAIAMESFAFFKPKDLRTQALHELTEEYWLSCIESLNKNDIRALYRALANLAKAATHQLISENKNPDGDNFKKLFDRLYSRMKVSENNFSERLNPQGIQLYTQLFREHAESFAQAHSELEKDTSNEIERQKCYTANYFFLLLLPAPNDFCANLPSQDQIRKAIGSEFDTRAFVRQYNEQRVAREQRIKTAKLACLSLLSAQLSSEKEQWKLEGIAATHFLSPLISCCSPNFGRKTPQGIAKIEAILNQKKEEAEKYKAIKNLLAKKNKKSCLWRSEKTKQFYSLWAERFSSADDHGAIPKLAANLRS